MVRRAGDVAVAAVVVLLMGGAAGPARAVPAEHRPAGPRHDIVVAELPSLGGQFSFPVDVDRRGRVVGQSRDTSGLRRAVLWEGGRVTDLTSGSPGESAAAAINERGVVAGSFFTESTPIGSFPSDAFAWRRGTLTVLGDPSLDGAVDVNDRGQVLVNGIGLGGPPATGYRAAVWRGSDVVLSPPLAGGRHLGGVGMNERGQVIGVDGQDPGAHNGQLWTPGRSPVDLGALAGGGSFPLAIDDRARVVGTSRIDGGRQRMFLWRAAPMIDLGTLGGDQTGLGVSFAIDGDRRLSNTRGEVVGESQTATGDRHAFLWRDGQMTDLGTLGGSFSRAESINDRGQVVGLAETATGESHAFVWQDGHMVDLGAVTGGTGSSVATKITDTGHVIGTRTEPDGRVRAYLWTVPRRLTPP